MRTAPTYGTANCVSYIVVVGPHQWSRARFALWLGMPLWVTLVELAIAAALGLL